MHENPNAPNDPGSFHLKRRTPLPCSDQRNWLRIWPRCMRTDTHVGESMMTAEMQPLGLERRQKMAIVFGKIFNTMGQRLTRKQRGESPSFRMESLSEVMPAMEEFCRQIIPQANQDSKLQQNEWILPASEDTRIYRKWCTGIHRQNLRRLLEKGPETRPASFQTQCRKFLRRHWIYRHIFVRKGRQQFSGLWWVF